jgi:hypothetical protein
MSLPRFAVSCERCDYRQQVDDFSVGDYQLAEDERIGSERKVHEPQKAQVFHPARSYVPTGSVLPLVGRGRRGRLRSALRPMRRVRTGFLGPARAPRGQP